MFPLNHIHIENVKTNCGQNQRRAKHHITLMSGLCDVVAVVPHFPLWQLFCTVTHQNSNSIQYCTCVPSRYLGHLKPQLMIWLCVPLCVLPFNTSHSSADWLTLSWQTSVTAICDLPLATVALRVSRAMGKERETTAECLLLLVCVKVCVHFYVHVCGHLRPKSGVIFYCSLHRCCYDVVVIIIIVTLETALYWLVGQQDLGIHLSASPLTLPSSPGWNYRHLIPGITFYLGAGNLNSGPLAYTTSIASAKELLWEVFAAVELHYQEPVALQCISKLHRDRFKLPNYQMRFLLWFGINLST